MSWKVFIVDKHELPACYKGYSLLLLYVVKLINYLKIMNIKEWFVKN